MKCGDQNPSAPNFSQMSYAFTCYAMNYGNCEWPEDWDIARDFDTAYRGHLALKCSDGRVS